MSISVVPFASSCLASVGRLLQQHGESRSLLLCSDMHFLHSPQEKKDKHPRNTVGRDQEFAPWNLFGLRATDRSKSRRAVFVVRDGVLFRCIFCLVLCKYS